MHNICTKYVQYIYICMYTIYIHIYAILKPMKTRHDENTYIYIYSYMIQLYIYIYLYIFLNCLNIYNNKTNDINIYPKYHRLSL